MFNEKSQFNRPNKQYRNNNNEQVGAVTLIFVNTSLSQATQYYKLQAPN